MATGWLERLVALPGFLIHDWTICALIIAAKTIVNAELNVKDKKRYRITAMIGTLSSLLLAIYLCMFFFGYVGKMD